VGGCAAFGAGSGLFWDSMVTPGSWVKVVVICIPAGEKWQLEAIFKPVGVALNYSSFAFWHPSAGRN
jgi:hypothetical protein